MVNAFNIILTVFPKKIWMNTVLVDNTLKYIVMLKIVKKKAEFC